MKREPDLQGPGVRAWRAAIKPLTKAQEATVRCWIVNGPFHPAWCYLMVCAVHLRPIEGVRPAVLHFPDASHEIMIVSLESPPGGTLVPDEDDPETIRHLTPPDCVQQVAGLTDDQAARICDLIVRRACDGMTLDVDARRYWQRSIIDTADHYRRGLHDGAA